MTFNCELSKNIPEVLKKSRPQIALFNDFKLYFFSEVNSFSKFELLRFEFKFFNNQYQT